MRWILFSLVVLAAAVAAAFAVVPGLVERDTNRVIEHAPYRIGERAATLHDSLRIADWHSDSLLWDRDLHQRADYGHVDLPRLAEGNVTLQVFTAVTKSPAGQNYEENSAESDRITLLALAQAWPPRTWDSPYERALYQAERLHGFEADDPAALSVVTDRVGLDAALAARQPGGEGPLVALLGIEGMHALDADLAHLDGLWEAGYRIFGLQHFFDNALGGSLHGLNKGGLTDFGRSVVLEIDRRGGIIDLAHSSPAVVEDVLALIETPVIVSHTGLAGACDSPRNIPDALMARIAARGGLIGIGYWDAAVCDPTPEAVAASLAYGIDTFGVEAISLGSDYDGATEVSFDTAELAVLTRELLELERTEGEIRRVMGENSLDFLARHLP